MLAEKPFGIDIHVSAVNRRAAAAELMELAYGLLTGELLTSEIRVSPAAESRHKVVYQESPAIEAGHPIREGGCERAVDSSATTGD